MFKRLARFRRHEQRPLQPHWLDVAHCNDNQRNFPPAEGRRPSRVALACRWSLADGSRLQCAWEIERFDE
ncbi:unnamed protein product, partial [Phaeothamnion confervicola]